jgi:hypothetical protein
MRARYTSRRDAAGGGWSIFDRTTGKVAESNGVPHEGLEADDADEILEMLNAVEAKRRAVSKKGGLFRRMARERYYSKRGSDGWAVYDATTGRVAEVSGSPQTGLSADDADDLVDMLNRIEATRP